MFVCLSGCVRLCVWMLTRVARSRCTQKLVILHARPTIMNPDCTSKTRPVWSNLWDKTFAKILGVNSHLISSQLSLTAQRMVVINNIPHYCTDNFYHIPRFVICLQCAPMTRVIFNNESRLLTHYVCNKWSKTFSVLKLKHVDADFNGCCSPSSSSDVITTSRPELFPVAAWKFLTSADLAAHSNGHTVMPWLHVK